VLHFSFLYFIQKSFHQVGIVILKTTQNSPRLAFKNHNSLTEVVQIIALTVKLLDTNL